MNQHRAFMSFARHDDQHEEGKLSTLRQHLSNEMQAYTGQTFSIFQRTNTQWGQVTAQRITSEIAATSFFIAVITPSFFTDETCRNELTLFLARQRELGRDDLILPICYIPVAALAPSNTAPRDSLVQAIAERTCDNWHDLRFEPLESPQVRRRIAAMAHQICECMQSIDMHDIKDTPSTLVSPSVVPTTTNSLPTLHTIKRVALEQRLAELAEEYTAVSNQRGRMLSDGDVLKLQRQIAHIEQEMQQIEEALHERN